MMDHFEYKVIPAPRRGVRAKGVKTAADKFANALQTSINELSAKGWEYVRAESLPADERRGLTFRKTETYQNVLIFRRPASQAEPLLTTPVVEAEESENLFDDIDDEMFPEEVETTDDSDVDTDSNEASEETDDKKDTAKKSGKKKS